MAHHYSLETPFEVKNATGIHLVTQSTPNGQATQILLEELKEKYGIKFTTTVISISTDEQKKDWFLRLNPNGRIPLLIDNNWDEPFPSHETSAQMLYLTHFYDKNYEFSFQDPREQSTLEQWTLFWHGSGAPYQGNNNYFRRQEQPIEFAINRFRNETLRVYGVLEIQLSGKYTGEPKDYLAGKGKGKYSVADMKAWPWVKNYKTSGFTDEEMAAFPHLLTWLDRIATRAAVKRGIGNNYALDGPNTLRQ